MKKNIFLITLIGLSIHSIDANSILKNSIVNLLCLPFAHNKASDKTQQQVKDILKKLNPKIQKTVQVRQLNTLARYLFGYQNAIALPYGDCIAVNEKWLEELPQDAQKFVLARTLVPVMRPDEYCAKQYVLPFLAYILCEKTKSENLQEMEVLEKDVNSNLINTLINEPERYNQLMRMREDNREELGARFILWNIIYLCLKKFARSVEYDLDNEAAKKLVCAQGGVEALEDTIKFKHDSTFLGSVFSTFPLLSLSSILDSIKKMAPGRFIETNSRWPHFWRYSMPLAHNFQWYPRPHDRIEALKFLARQQKAKK